MDRLELEKFDKNFYICLLENVGNFGFGGSKWMIIFDKTSETIFPVYNRINKYLTFKTVKERNSYLANLGISLSHPRQHYDRIEKLKTNEIYILGEVVNQAIIDSKNAESLYKVLKDL